MGTSGKLPVLIICQITSYRYNAVTSYRQNTFLAATVRVIWCARFYTRITNRYSNAVFNTFTWKQCYVSLSSRANVSKFSGVYSNCGYLKLHVHLSLWNLLSTSSEQVALLNRDESLFQNPDTWTTCVIRYHHQWWSTYMFVSATS